MWKQQSRQKLDRERAQRFQREAKRAAVKINNRPSADILGDLAKLKAGQSRNRRP